MKRNPRKDSRPPNPKYLYRGCPSGKVGYTSERVATNTARQVSKVRGYSLQGVYRCRTCGEYHLYSIKPKSNQDFEINAGGLNFTAKHQSWSQRAPWAWKLASCHPEFIPVQSTQAGSMAMWDCIIRAIEYVESLGGNGRPWDAEKWVEAARAYVASQRELL